MVSQMHNKGARPRESLYVVFITNVLKTLQLRGMSQRDLSRSSGISTSFLAATMRGRSNPSLRTMERIAAALMVPLTALLETHDLPEEDEATLLAPRCPQGLPDGYKRVSAVLPAFRAYLVTQWSKEARTKILKAS